MAQTMSQIALAALAHVVDQVDLPRGMQKIINTHIAFHGTPTKNVSSISIEGLKESLFGALGRGVYTAHDFNKAK